MIPRSAILIGVGDFGHDVLRRLLRGGALRGMLHWRRPRGGDRPTDRSLRDLALIWLPDRDGSPSSRGDEEVDFEMMRDLYRQIQTADGSGDRSAVLSELVWLAASELLSARRQDELGHQAPPLGLDVFVVAHPSEEHKIGELDLVLKPVIERLGRHVMLERGAEAAAPVSWIEILDFAEFWQRTPRGSGLRRAVHDSIRKWQNLRLHRRPSIGRCYLVDGSGAAGVRARHERVDEISLMLEFLLFEGQRSGDLQGLYGLRPNQTSPLASFGIRMIERSWGLLSRLAAARFGVGWLDYLASSNGGSERGEPALTRDLLASFRPERLDVAVGAGEFEEKLDEELGELRTRLLAISPGALGWRDQLRSAYREHADGCRVRLSQLATRRTEEVFDAALSRLEERLRGAVQSDLHRSEKPATLSAVLDEIESIQAEIDHYRASTATAGRVIGRLPRSFDELQTRIDRFDWERLDPNRTRLWQLFALTSAAALTPLLVELLKDIPAPDALAHPLIIRGYELLLRLNNAVAVSVFLFTTLLLWGGLVRRRLSARMERARSFHVDNERGRFANAVRAALEPQGELGSPLHRYLERLVADLKLRVSGEASRILERGARRLRARRREIDWLRDQLGEFLRVEGVTDGPTQSDFELGVGSSTLVRSAMKKSDDLGPLLRANPPEPSRYQSLQASLQPFGGWADEYCDTFLSPLAFLDRLSQAYSDPLEHELARPGVGPGQQEETEDLVRFLEHPGALRSTFRWLEQEGLPNARRYCVLPPRWRGLARVQQALADLGVGANDTLEGAAAPKAFLLEVREGIDPSCLIDTG